MHKFTIFVSILIFLGTGLITPPAMAASESHLWITGQILDSATQPVQIQASTNDPYYNQQWYLQRIKANQAWNITTGTDLTIAVIDTGVDYHHPDLAGKMWVNSGEILNNGRDDDGNGYIDDYYGYNFIDNVADVDDFHGHGTGIASIIAARTNNSRGIAGINWNAKIMALKALNNTGGGDFDDVARAIRYAVDNGADIINMSFGSLTSSAILANAVNYAVSKGVPMVAAVGNDSRNSIFYPAAYPEVIAVSGIDRADRHPDFANYGSGIDLVAPATEITMAGLVDGPAGSYVTGAGTSFATAQVTGAASLVLGRFPTTTPSELEALLKDKSDVLSVNDANYFGAGVLNAYKSVDAPLPAIGTVSVINSQLPADGITTTRVTLTAQNADGRYLTNQEILLNVTGDNTIIGGKVIPAAKSFSLGQTNGSGQISFEMASTSIGVKQLTFVEKNSQTTIRANASITFTSPTRPVYSMQWVAQSPYPTLPIGSSTQMWLDVKNTGNVAWVSDAAASTTGRGQMKLGTDRTMDRVSLFKSPTWLSGNRIGYMTPAVVQPGETARFTFTLLASQVGNFREYFRPVIEHVTWLNDLGIYWDVHIDPINGQSSSTPTEIIDTDQTHYQAALNSRGTGVTMSPGDITRLTVTLTNVGSATWFAQGSGTNRFGEVRVGTASAQDRISPFHYLAWISPNRAINAGTNVAPGERLTLNFDIQAPITTGTYVENFQLVSEYVGWFGPIFSWTITVI